MRGKKMKSMTTYRPTYAEVDLSAIRYNFSQFRKITGGADKVKILAAVKANAYGHGLIQVAKALSGCGVDYFGVGTIDEGIALKKAGLNTPVLNLTTITKDEIAPVVRYNITQTVPDIMLAKSINRIAKKKGIKAKVHLKIDTGMGRLGVWHKEAIGFIKEAVSLKNLDTEGIFTHFSSAEENKAVTEGQMSVFLKLLDELKHIGISLKYRHMANSAASVSYKGAHLNLIRPGIMLYGLYPHPSLKRKIKLKPALEFKSRIAYIKRVTAGSRISYGGTYTIKTNTKIAIAPVGYGDGYNRILSGKANVLINGKQRPIAGRVCMDQLIIDLGKDSRAALKDEVVLIGKQGKNRITAEEIALICGTIPYEVTCWISSRVPRIYKNLK
jgi:alanine racemase